MNQDEWNSEVAKRGEEPWRNPLAGPSGRTCGLALLTSISSVVPATWPVFCIFNLGVQKESGLTYYHLVNMAFALRWDIVEVCTCHLVVAVQQCGVALSSGSSYSFLAGGLAGVS